MAEERESKALILIGMMGAGKSAVGRSMAEISGRKFVDTDILVRDEVGRSIPQIFKIYGESMFRDFETVVLRKLEPDPIILATGGGIVLRHENWTELHRLGRTIYLRSKPENIISRLKLSRKKRPLLETENWEQRVHDILAERMSLYEKASIIIDVDDVEIDEAAHIILNLMDKRAQ